MDRLINFSGQTISDEHVGAGREAFDGRLQVLGFYLLGMDQHVRNFQKLLVAVGADTPDANVQRIFRNVLRAKAPGNQLVPRINGRLGRLYAIEKVLEALVAAEQARVRNAKKQVSDATKAVGKLTGQDIKSDDKETPPDVLKLIKDFRAAVAAAAPLFDNSPRYSRMSSCVTSSSRRPRRSIDLRKSSKSRR